MDDHSRHHLKRGIFWLGSANLVTQLLDIGSIIVILWFLTKEEMGVATLAWTVAVILESFNGLGIGTAILQAPGIERKQLDSAWWYVMGVASILFLAVGAGSPLVARYYAAPELTAMIAVSASKLLFVGAALIPLQMLNRDLRFKEIGAVQTSATLLSSVVKITLAATGFGAWALVIGHASHGLFTALGANLLRPFFPRLHFAFSEIKALVLFGIRVATSAIIYHFYRNADYLVVGRFLGKEALGVYRVAFDVAMTPALTMLNVANRAALPVFARLALEPAKLKETFLWVQRNLAFLLFPVALFLSFTAHDLLLLFGDGKWAEAATALQVLSWASVLRCLAMVFPQLFHATGKPQYAIYDSLMAMTVLIGTFTGAIWLFKDTLGILAVCYGWLFSYPILLLFLWIFARRIIKLPILEYLGGLRHAVFIALLTAALLVPVWYFRAWLPSPQIVSPVLATGLIVGSTVAYARLVLGLRFTEMFKRAEG